MHVLIGIALKSLLISGATLGLLKLMTQRSAAERSWVAHIGLLALIVTAFAPLALPSWTVETPALLSPAVEAAPAPQPALAVAAANNIVPVSTAKPETAALTKTVRPTLSPAVAATVLYSLPAAALLLITLLALMRLVALRARADVLVDGHWLSALARAQRRMGFKHGTALLTSDELASPISWGLMRPVILLNSRAVEAAGEAEAIIAHELAHVARMDWIKLLLARIATALFWFNPLVWILAREAHQLREEAADDSVLAADIPDTDYAQLLVGVARHECPGLLLGAHGVAPSKSSLARRVARVLDGKSVRGPVARSFALGVLAGAMLVAGPLAALTLTPSASKPATPARGTVAPALATPTAEAMPADLPHIIADGVSASVATATAAIAPVATPAKEAELSVRSPSDASVDSANGTIFARGASGASATIYPADAQGKRRVVARSSNGATAVSYIDADDIPDIAGSDHGRRHKRAIDLAIEMKAIGVTPEYLAAVKSASPALRDADVDDIVGMKAVGVTPDYIRGLAGVGYANLDADDLTQARAVGVSPDYARSILSTGLRPTMEELVELRAMNINAADIRRSGATGSVSRHELRRLVVPRVRPPLTPVPNSPGDN